MTSQEIEHLKITLPKKVFNRNDLIWKKAFSSYIEATDRKLGMGCSNCYQKVYEYLNKKYN